MSKITCLPKRVFFLPKKLTSQLFDIFMKCFSRNRNQQNSFDEKFNLKIFNKCENAIHHHSSLARGSKKKHTDYTGIYNVIEWSKPKVPAHFVNQEVTRIFPLKTSRRKRKATGKGINKRGAHWSLMHSSFISLFSPPLQLANRWMANAPAPPRFFSYFPANATMEWLQAALFIV
jgi:hypothetical protein